jgi:hypothetical protein
MTAIALVVGVPRPVLWMIPATLLVAALVALPPARSVAGVPAAATLRSE